MLLAYSLWIHQVQARIWIWELLNIHNYSNMHEDNNLEPPDGVLYLVLPAQGHQVRAWIWKLVMVEQSGHPALQID